VAVLRTVSPTGGVHVAPAYPLGDVYIWPVYDENNDRTIR